MSGRRKYKVGHVTNSSSNSRYIRMDAVDIEPKSDGWDPVAEAYLAAYEHKLPESGLLGLIILNVESGYQAFVPLEPFVPEPMPRYRVKR